MRPGNGRLGAGGAERRLQMLCKRGSVLRAPEIPLQNLAVGSGIYSLLVLLLINAKEEIKLLFVPYPPNLGKFLLKPLETRALLNPLKIGASAPGLSVVRVLAVLGSSLAALQLGARLVFLPVPLDAVVVTNRLGGHRGPRVYASARPKCLLARRVWGSTGCFPAFWEGKGLQAASHTAIPVVAQATKPPFFR